MCCARLAGNARPKNSPSGHHRTTMSGDIFTTKTRIDNQKKKLVQRQCLHHMSSQYGELRPTSGWDLLASLRHPCKFQRVLHLGSVTARHSSSGRQPNFAALNRGRHLYSAERPSRWALAHILVNVVVTTCGRLWQVHCADVDGNGPVQAAEDSEAEQRPHLLLPLPDPPRTQVHPLCQRSPSRSQAE